MSRGGETPPFFIFASGEFHYFLQHYQISRATAPFAVLFSVHISTIDVSFFDIGKNLSKLVNAIYSAVCEESIGGFEPIRNLTEKNFE